MADVLSGAAAAEWQDSPMEFITTFRLTSPMEDWRWLALRGAPKEDDETRGSKRCARVAVEKNWDRRRRPSGSFSSKQMAARHRHATLTKHVSEQNRSWYAPSFHGSTWYWYTIVGVLRWIFLPFFFCCCCSNQEQMDRDWEVLPLSKKRIQFSLIDKSNSLNLG